MKTLKTLAILALMGLVVTACGKVEKILVKKDGKWEETSYRVDNYTNNVLTGSYTETDSLDLVTFADNGTGFFTDFQGNNRENFTWTVNGDNDVITITDNSQFSVAYDVLESSGKDQSWKGTIESTVGSDVYKTEIFVDLARLE